MDLNDTRLMLEQIRTFDHRVIDDQAITEWQRALTRLPVEEVFDAIHDHYEKCNNAAAVALTPAEILRHRNETRAHQTAEERRRLDRERNETIFGELKDHRTPAQFEASLAAMRAGRAHLNQILAARKPTTTETDQAPISEGVRDAN